MENEFLNEAVQRAIKARENAVLIHSSKVKVGACLYTKDGRFFDGWNIQNYCHKSYHAEEIALLNCMINKGNLNELEGITISFDGNNIERLTFACGHCRQYLWEYTKNENLLVTEVDENGEIIKSITLGELYPYPYPRDREKDNSEKK